MHLLALQFLSGWFIGLVSRGIKEASLVNLIATIAKIVPIVIFIFTFIAFKRPFQTQLF